MAQEMKEVCVLIGLSSRMSCMISKSDFDIYFVTDGSGWVSSSLKNHKCESDKCVCEEWVCHMINRNLFIDGKSWCTAGTYKYPYKLCGVYFLRDYGRPNPIIKKHWWDI